MTAVVQTADTKNGVVTSNSTSWTLVYPTNLQSGELILGLVSTDGSPSYTFPAGWNSGRKSSGANTLITAMKISDGAETGNFTLSLGASEQGAWRIYRITNWYGSGIPAGNLDAQSDGDGASWSNFTSTSSSNPDPANLDPANWASEDTLWFAACGVDTSRTISVYPLPDLNTADVSGGAGGATLGVCSDSLTQASLDPGTFTISAADDWVTVTVAVRPAAAAPLTEDKKVPAFAELRDWSLSGRVVR